MCRRLHRTLAMLVLAVAIAGCTVEAAPSAPGEDGPVRIDARAVPFHTTEPHREVAGRLRFRGGLALRSPDARFGGLSGLHVSPDGREMTAITDKGHWIRATLRHDADGRLVGVADGRIGALRDDTGRVVFGTRLHDAEALARSPEGFAVAFEGVHRVWLYADGPDGAPFAGRVRALPQPPGAAAARRNGGIEALAALPDGRLVALTEDLAAGPSELRGWIAGRDGPWRSFAWPRTGQFAPSDATALPDGDLLVLERRFSFAGGFAIRLVRVAAAALRPGATVSGEEIGTIAPPFTMDNFEGVAARRGARGETLIYLVVDDNFHPLQRTLLFMLELLPAG